MAIETICRGCAAKLRVADEFAGRQARCPHCRTVYTVPNAVPETVKREPERLAPATSLWRVRTADGTIYGPVDWPEIERWVAAGRVAPDSNLQLDGASDWQPATQLFPALQTQVSAVGNPFTDQLRQPTPSTNPYTTPLPGTAPAVSAWPGKPHRGVLILVLAVLGVVVCQFFSIAAWIMGAADLREIDAGRMDPDGRSLTQAGMIVGIIGCVLMLLTFCLPLIFVLIGVIGAGVQ